MDSSNSASGTLVLDDGQSLDPSLTQYHFTMYTFGALTYYTETPTMYFTSQKQINSVKFYGVAQQPSVVTNGYGQAQTFTYNSVKKILEVTNLSINLTVAYGEI